MKKNQNLVLLKGESSMKRIIVFAVLALAFFANEVSAKRLPKAKVHIDNELPGTLQMKVGHAWWDAELTLQPHKSGFLPLDQNETHIVHCRLFTTAGREVKFDYPIRVPAGTRQMTVVIGGTQIGVIFNRSGRMAWVMPPVQQSTGFVDLDLATVVNPDSVRLTAIKVKLLRAGVTIPDKAEILARKRMAKEESTGRATRGFISTKTLNGLRWEIMSDSLYAQGVPLKNGEAYLFEIQAPSQAFNTLDPTFVIFFDEKEGGRRLELTITGINSTREDQKFGGIWVDWFKTIDPRHWDWVVSDQ